MRYTAEIAWRIDDGDFAAGSYSRAHEWRFDGDTVVPASSSPDIVPLPHSDPAGVDPEEAMVASVSACHMLWFLDLARRAGFAVSGYRDAASGTLGKDDRGRMAMTRFELSPRIDFAGRQPSRDELAALHRDAHARCFIANSLRGEVVIAPES